VSHSSVSSIIVWSATSLCTFACSTASASFTLHSSYSSWSAAVGGGDAKIDFNLGSITPVTTQYQSLGVTFPPFSATAGPSSVASDGWVAITGFISGYAMTLTYATPQVGIGFDLIQSFIVDLYFQGTLIYSSPELNALVHGISGTQTFDKAVLRSVTGDTSAVDNIYVANPIPGPASAALLAAIGLGRRRRR
jgi:hypothetical protein